ncbi:MAG: TonB family protein [Nitrospira sp.]|nr:TonB family protein [Nitrospira sp.]
MAERVHQEIVKNSTYPMLARQYGWQGTVQLCLVLERDGTFSRVTVETSSGNAFLDNEAVRLVRSVQITDIPPVRPGRNSRLKSPLHTT